MYACQTLSNHHHSLSVHSTNSSCFLIRFLSFQWMLLALSMQYVIASRFPSGKESHRMSLNSQVLCCLTCSYILCSVRNRPFADLNSSTLMCGPNYRQKRGRPPETKSCSFVTFSFSRDSMYQRQSQLGRSVMKWSIGLPLMGALLRSCLTGMQYLSRSDSRGWVSWCFIFLSCCRLMGSRVLNFMVGCFFLKTVTISLPFFTLSFQSPITALWSIRSSIAMTSEVGCSTGVTQGSEQLGSVSQMYRLPFLLGSQAFSNCADMFAIWCSLFLTCSVRWMGWASFCSSSCALMRLMICRSGVVLGLEVGVLVGLVALVRANREACLGSGRSRLASMMPLVWSISLMTDSRWCWYLFLKLLLWISLVMKVS